MVTQDSIIQTHNAVYRAHDCTNVRIFITELKVSHHQVLDFYQMKIAVVYTCIMETYTAIEMYAIEYKSTLQNLKHFLETMEYSSIIINRACVRTDSNTHIYA